MTKGRFVCYYRVSTHKQGIKGLGIEVQKDTVQNFLNGGNWEIVDEFVEVESGKKDNRKELNRAIQACKLKNAKLIVSKLDRLSRDVNFISSLMKSDIKFIVAEMPEMNELTIHLFAAIAEHERKMISERTKAALKQAKRRGVRLGNPCIYRGEKIPGSCNIAYANNARIANANDYAQSMKQVILDIMSLGITSLNGIAKELNSQMYTTMRGCSYNATSVKRILER